MLDAETYLVPNGAGWQLVAKRFIDPDRFDGRRRPVAMVPGYGMNSFILGFHPTGPSMIEYLAAAGFEVWTMNLRAQDGTVRQGGRRHYTIGDVARVDLPAILNFIVGHTRSKRRRVDVIGCSLGATYLYAYAVLNRPNVLANIVALGGPLRWVEVHPALKLAFSQPWLLRRIDMRFTRTLCRLGLPLLAKMPGLLHIYMHPEIVDMSRTDELVETIEDPNPLLNEEIARWVGNRDLVIDGVNISEGFADVTNPLFCVQANADGVVPAATAFSALDLAGSKIKDSLIVGTDQVPMAHADMYISHYAQDWVFRPLADWLSRRQ